MYGWMMGGWTDDGKDAWKMGRWVGGWMDGKKEGRKEGRVASSLGTESVPPEVEVWSLNHWTTKEFPLLPFL